MNKILAGKTPPDIIEWAKSANFDERLSLLGLLLDGVNEAIHEFTIEEKVYESYFDFLKRSKSAFSPASADPAEVLNKQIRDNQIAIENGKKQGRCRRMHRPFNTGSTHTCKRRRGNSPAPA